MRLALLFEAVGFALRTLRRTPLVALTVVSTIALGLGVVTVAFTFFNSKDVVRHPLVQRIVEAYERHQAAARKESPRSEGDQAEGTQT